MLQLLHDRYLIVQRFLEVSITADQLLLYSLDGHLAPLITHCLINLTEGTLSQAVPLIYRVVLYLLDYVHLI